MAKKITKRQYAIAKKYMDKDFLSDKLYECEMYKSNITDEYQKVMEYCMEYGNTTGDYSTARIVHSTVAQSRDKFINFIMNMLFGVKAPWAKVDVQENILKNRMGFTGDTLKTEKKRYQEVNMENTNTAFEYMFSSNYYVEVFKAMYECGLLGTGCYKVEKTNSMNDPYFFIQKNFYEYYFCEDELGRTFHVFERLEDKTTPELKNLYPDVDFSGYDLEEFEEEDTETEHEIWEAITPVYDPKKGEYFFIRTISADKFGTILEQTVLDYNPYVIFRFSVIPFQPWGKGVGLIAVDAISKMIWLENKRRLQVGKQINPPMGGIGGKRLATQLDFSEGAYSYLGEPEINTQIDVRPLIPYHNFLPIDQDIAMLKQEIRDIFMAQPFGNFQEQEGAKPKNEIEYRMQLFRQEWAGTAELLERECLNPTFRIPYFILQDKKLLTQEEDLDLTANTVKFTNLLTKSSNLDNAQNRLMFNQTIQAMTGGLERFIWKESELIDRTSEEMLVDQRLLKDGKEREEAIQQHQQMVAQMVAQAQIEQQ